MGAEKERVEQMNRGEEQWREWGPYLPERLWGTVRECFSFPEEAWTYTTFDTARERHYLTGDEGIFGWCDKKGRLCFALALWNGKDPFLKERFFGLSGIQGNHGEDVKEYYYYLMAVPTYSYAKALYKYPCNAYPYEQLIMENQSRSVMDPEFELIETGIFDQSEYFDVVVEYAKGSPRSLVIRVIARNHSDVVQPLHILPQFWFRNIWYWSQLLGKRGRKPQMYLGGQNHIVLQDAQMGEYRVEIGEGTGGVIPTCLFIDNEPDSPKSLEGSGRLTKYRKDALTQRVVYDRDDFISAENKGTKVGIWYVFDVPPKGEVSLHIRFSALSELSRLSVDEEVNQLIQQRSQEAKEFYDEVLPDSLNDSEKQLAIQAYSGLLWSKITYQLSVKEWMYIGKNYCNITEHKSFRKWNHLQADDVLSVPDKWEYPWFASWDLPFHLVTMVRIDPLFALQQAKLFLSSRYQSPTGQIPASEWNFSSITPPVMAWGINKLLKLLPYTIRDGNHGEIIDTFLIESFCSLYSNWLWWLNLKDSRGDTLFTNGFIGLDNFSVIERYVDGNITAEDTQGIFWTPFFLGNLLELACKISLRFSQFKPIVARLLEQFIKVCEILNHNEVFKYWCENDKFFYPYLRIDNELIQVNIRGFSGLLPLFGVVHFPIHLYPEIREKVNEWLSSGVMDRSQFKYYRLDENSEEYLFISCISESQRNSLLNVALSSSEFLSPYGLRSLSRYHREKPIYIHSTRRKYEIRYCPAELESKMFGGNTNWYGPIWFPLNYLFIDAMEKWSISYPEPFELGEEMTNTVTFREIADDIRKRLLKLFMEPSQGGVPYWGTGWNFFKNHPEWGNYHLFFEYFNGDTGEGIGANHQTGWTALIAEIIQELAR